MRVLLLLGSVLLVSVLGARAAPTEDVDAAVPSDCSEAVPIAAPEANPHEQPATYRKETLDTLSTNKTQSNVKTKTKDKVKLIKKVRRDGSVVTIIKDKSKSKTTKDDLTDSFNQTNHTLTEGGIEDSTSLTDEKEHEAREVDISKKVDTERIVTDKYGNVISDKHTTKEKDKVKKKEKDKETHKLVHTVKKVDPPADAPAQEPAEVPDQC